MNWLDDFEAKLEIQPPVTAEHLARLPAKRGVALLLADENRPIVLLPCADIRSRVWARMRNPQEDPRQKMPDLGGITRLIAWKLTGGHFETDLVFLELAQRIWPRTYESLLAVKKAWFVHVNPAETYPRFARADDVFESPGRYFGPFPNGRSADRFVEAVQEAFDLCRDIRCLRQSPNAARCSYGQMGRCLCPCDGSIPMEQYRKVVADTADYVAGDRQGLLESLKSQMKQAALKLEFEKAGAIKSHLKRLAVLEAEEFRHVAKAEDFRFLLVQPSGSRGKATVFYAAGGTVLRMSPLAYPPKFPELEALLAQLAAPTTTPTSAAPVTKSGEASDVAARTLGQWRMALVSHYLYCSPERSGLIIPVRPKLTAESLATQLDEWALTLRLVKPPRRQSPEAETESQAPSSERPSNQ